MLFSAAKQQASVQHLVAHVLYADLARRLKPRQNQRVVRYRSIADRKDKYQIVRDSRVSAADRRYRRPLVHEYRGLSSQRYLKNGCSGKLFGPPPEASRVSFLSVPWPGLGRLTESVFPIALSVRPAIAGVSFTRIQLFLPHGVIRRPDGITR